MGTSAAKRPRVGRDRILEVAEEMFAQQGYRAVSIRDIARACGVTNAALYYHFPSKEALFREVLHRHLDHLRERMLAAAQGQVHFRDKLHAMLEVYAATLRRHRTSMFVWRRELLALKGPSSHERKALFQYAQQAVLAPLGAVLAEAIREGEIHAPGEQATTLAAMLVGLVSGALFANRSPSDEEIRSAVRRAVEIFLFGVSTRRESGEGSSGQPTREGEKE